METQRFVVMGAGEVGFHLARSLSNEGHEVVVIEMAAERRERIEDELDVLVVAGNGAHAPVLEAANVEQCDLFLAVSSNDEANLAGSLLAKRLGAKRSAVRVAAAAEVIGHRGLYEETFGADLLLSTELLTTTRVLNLIRGHNTMAVEYFAGGKVQLRKTSIEAGSLLTTRPLRDLELPDDSLVVAFFRGDELIIPGGDDRAEVGDEALILATTDAITDIERMVCPRPGVLGTVVLAGGGDTGTTVAEALAGLDVPVKIIERDRETARQLAARFPDHQILHGDATDVSLLRSERIGGEGSFIALTGNDETNLMSSLLAQELNVPLVAPMVERAETFELWRRLGLTEVFSPRQLAYERIHEYIESGFSSNIVSLQKGEAVVVERQLHEASPAAGVTLAEMSPPRGLIVGAVARGRKVFVPAGKDRLEAGDLVILFVRKEELGTVQLLFPARETIRQGAA
ncbi:MAG TPA: Trk system potassium transporter TrkA [Thermoanaerobaculia bacterium]|nr:Trk system potassium transporter TrkA [Thermoanaerobaculia bacterium]